MTRHLITLIVAMLSASCAAGNRRCSSVAHERASAPGPNAPATATTAPETSAPSTEDWLGVYASTSEIGGFSGTVLALRKPGLGHAIFYRMRFYSDIHSEGDIEQDERSGSCITDGDALYLPMAHGRMEDGKPELLATVSRYTRVVVTGHETLMRDDALRAYRDENKLYDYGILVKVHDNADAVLDLKQVELPSIKMLYADPTRAWKDPFVSGPNRR